MKRKFLAVFAILLLLLQIPAFAASDSQPSVETAYYLDGSLYVYAQFPGYENVGEQFVDLLKGGARYDSRTPWKLTEQAEPVEYLLLIDCSGSMQAYEPTIRTLANALLASEYDTEVTVAYFGEDFHVASEQLTDREEIRNALGRLRYNEQWTDICGATVSAMDYVKAELWEPGLLTNIILITDGEPSYSSDRAEDRTRAAETAKKLEQTLEESPQVILHSVCFKEWDQTTYDAVCSGGGLHLVPGRRDADLAGGKIVAYYDGLYRLAYQLSSYSSDLALKVPGRVDPIPVLRVADLTGKQYPEAGERPGVIGPAESEAPVEETEPPEESPEPTEAPEPMEKPSEVTEKPEDTAPADAPREETKILGLAPLVFGLICGGAVLLIVIIILLILLLRKWGGGNAAVNVPVNAAAPPVTTAPAGAAGIPMQLEVLYGAVQGDNRRFVLKDSLMIGSDDRCDIVAPDSSVAPIHARVFLKNGEVCIEDLNSATGTALGGMRIYAPNVLRSGDQIMVGQVCIAFYF